VIFRVFLAVAFATVMSGVAAAEPAVTFSKDIAPIVFAKCAMCHHAGGSAPFSLLTYATARSHATQIGEATRSGLMPPWKAEAGVGGDFIGQQHLTDQELAVIQQWVQAGAPEGEPRDLPSTPRFTDDWQLGRPDLVVTTPAYTLGAGDRGIVRRVLLPSSAPEIAETLRMVLGWAWTYVIVAELIGASSGIGHMITDSQALLATDQIIFGIIVIGLIGLVTDFAFKAFNRKLFPWAQLGR